MKKLGASTRALRQFRSVGPKISSEKNTTSFSSKPFDRLDDFLKFNDLVGNPINKLTGQPQPMTWYQLQYHECIQTYHKIIVNKARKIGATEAAIRSIAFNCFHRYAGHDVMIIAGNEMRIAKEILLRFNQLFEDKTHQDGIYSFKENRNVWQYSDLIRKANFGQDPIVEFRNDTRVFCFPASKQGRSQSFRGTDDVICAFVSEAAHTGMTDDQPIMNALEPNLAQRDDGDLILESTPNGKTGFFYNYWTDAISGKLPSWKCLQWNWQPGVQAGILSDKFIKEERQNVRIDFEQEYNCKFTSSRTAAFTEDDLNYLDGNDDVMDYRTMLGMKSVPNN